MRSTPMRQSAFVFSSASKLLFMALAVLFGLAGCAADTGETEGQQRSAATVGRPFVFAASNDGGVYAFSINETTGALTQVASATAVTGLGHAEATTNGRVFATASWGGYLRAFAFDPDAGTLTKLGDGMSTGLTTNPSHVAFSPQTNQVYVSHLATSQISIVPFDGTPGASTFGSASELLLPSQGPHQLVFHPTHNRAYAPCLDARHVAQFSRNTLTGALTAAAPPTVGMTEDARFMAIHPDGTTAYVLTQAGSSVHVFNIDAAGSLVYPAVQVIKAVSWSAHSADIKLTPNGNFLYTTNRNAANMTAFSVGADHRLTNVGTANTGSSRVFDIDPSGRFVYVGLGTGIGIWSINQTTGALTSLGTVSGLGSVRAVAARLIAGDAPDQSPPSLSNISSSASATAATITWTTDEPATSRVDFGSTQSYGNQVSNATLVTSHSVSLTGLTPSSTYHFQVSSSDGANNNAASADFVFTTLTPDTQGPVISNVNVTPSATTAVITFTTNEPGTSVINYGPTPALGNQATTPGLHTSHSVTLSSLSPLTTYYFDIVSVDAASNQGQDTGRSLTTTAPVGPQISGVAVTNVGLHTAQVSWTTSVPTTTRIDYDTDTWTKTVQSATLTTQHSVTIDRMIAGAPHSFVISGTDAGGNGVTDSTRSFTTAAYSGGALPSGWSSLDIGPVNAVLPGSAKFDQAVNGGSFVVQGTGTDIWNAQDSFHFVYRPVTGNFVFTVRVDGYYGYLHQWTKAMTMFRVDLDSNSQFFNQSINYSGLDYLYYRGTKGGTHTELSSAQLNPTLGQPVWARLTRTGNTFTEEYSQNGTSWVPHGPAAGTTVLLPSSGFVGIGVVSKDNAYLSEIVYSNVSLVETGTSDTTPPAVSGITVTPSGSSAVVAFNTNEAASTSVNYGTTTAYGSTANGAAAGTQHTITLNGLTQNTTYNFRIVATDTSANVTTTTNQTFNSGSVSTPGLPAGWSGINLGGSVAAGGSSSHVAGVFTVTGGGGDLWGYQDNGHLVYQAVTGDFELIADVTGYSGNLTQYYGKAALVFKEDTGAGTPTARGRGIYQSLNYQTTDYWYERGPSGINSYNDATLNTTGGPARLRLTRTGNTFRSYHWDNSSSSWVQHGGDRVVALPSAGYLGLAATSSGTPLMSAQFANVQVIGGGTSDATAPILSNIGASAGATTATVTWTTNEPATSRVDFGTSSSYGNQLSTSALVTSHSVMLTGLSPSTTYHFQASSADAASNNGVSGDLVFTTLTPDTTAPAISNVSVTHTDVAAVVTWTTNEPATSFVNYGATPALGSQATSPGFATSHSVTLSALSPLTTYYFDVVSADPSANQAEDSGHAFMTAECSDGATQPGATTCGLNGNGTTTELCVGGAWQDAGTCDDPDECVNGAVLVEACGFNGNGTFTSTCSDGSWAAGTCIDPDVCANGATRAGTVPCEGGTWSEVCVSGQWQPDACVLATSPYVFAAANEGGVYAFSINQTTGALTQVASSAALSGLGHGEATTDGRVFATASWGGYLRAFAFNPANGTFTTLGDGRSTGLTTNPSHVAFSPQTNQVYVTHYSTNQISTVPFNATPGATTFGAATEIVLTGQGVNQLLFHPTLNMSYVPCMTTRRVSQFTRNTLTGALTAATPPTVAMTEDARLMALHPDGTTAYVLSQAGSSVHVFNLDSAGSLVFPAVQVIKAMSWSALSADIKLTPNGNFLYTTNRNAANMTVFQVGADHRLTNVGTANTGSARVFAIDPTGRFAYVGTGTGIGVWSINQTTGALTSVSSVTGLGSVRGVAARNVAN